MGILVDDLEESEIEKKGKKRGKSGGGFRGGIWRGGGHIKEICNSEKIYHLQINLGYSKHFYSTL